MATVPPLLALERLLLDPCKYRLILRVNSFHHLLVMIVNNFEKIYLARFGERLEVDRKQQKTKPTRLNEVIRSMRK